ncbi:hypothetical protein DFR86_07910 [Acidianus sulfidivorans JP7]|uniref:Uncharacterized protein n=1 Tax=Acidianus sulfidivorans JP7 TaxID=619593 RepID=A0A2U9IN92_9CREN|nr:hypothetical protein [Acidianus sulfidivorans]AWR97481.1 hypothetical protein DFR86_07910 [Acidianus sulfidivorans JP7]
MKLLLILNKYSGAAVLLLISVIGRLMSIPWLYQFLYYLFTLPDYSFEGLMINIGIIFLLVIIIVPLAIVKGIISLYNLKNNL